MKGTLKEEFAKKEKNISDLINGNFEITMRKTRKSHNEIKDLRKEINEFKESLEFTEKTTGKTRPFIKFTILKSILILSMIN